MIILGIIKPLSLNTGNGKTIDATLASAMKAFNLFWPIILSLLAHGVFVVFWHPMSDVTFSPPQPIQVEFRPAGTPQGDNQPTGGGQPSVAQSKPSVSKPEPKKTAATQPVLTKPAAARTAESQPTASIHQPVRNDAVATQSNTSPGGNSASGKSEGTGGGNAAGGAGNGKGNESGDGQGRGAKGDGPPVKVYSPKPKYPDRSRELQEEGSVHLRLTVTRDGQPRDVTVTGSSGFPKLDRAAQDGVANWRFKPAIKNGEPVDYIYKTTVTFHQTDA